MESLPSTGAPSGLVEPPVRSGVGTPVGGEGGLIIIIIIIIKAPNQKWIIKN
jgi:GAF domain-containing protein